MSRYLSSSRYLNHPFESKMPQTTVNWNTDAFAVTGGFLTDSVSLSCSWSAITRPNTALTFPLWGSTSNLGWLGGTCRLPASNADDGMDFSTRSLASRKYARGLWLELRWFSPPTRIMGRSDEFNLGGHHGKQALKCIVTNYEHWHATKMLFTLVTL